MIIMFINYDTDAEFFDHYHHPYGTEDSVVFVCFWTAAVWPLTAHHKLPKSAPRR